MRHVSPARTLEAYTCPHCGVYASQSHFSSHANLGSRFVGHDPQRPLGTTQCRHCEQYSVWFGSAMLYPNRGAAPPPNPDMPDDVRLDYEEAAGIQLISPRGAAALLRLAVQKLCTHLGEKGGSINEDIKSLVAKGLHPTIQESLDIVRITGNNAVHPGQINTDDPKVVENLFPLLNLIVEEQITRPMKVKKLYEDLPASDLNTIEKRDA